MCELGISKPYVLLQRTACAVGLPNSGHGTAYTRNPNSGEEMDYGRYILGYSGRAFDTEMQNRPEKNDLSLLLQELPNAYWHLRTIMATLEQYYQEIRFVEFTIEAGELFLVQNTPRKREMIPDLKVTRPLKVDWRNANGLEDIISCSNRIQDGTKISNNGLSLRFNSTDPGALEDILETFRPINTRETHCEEEWCITWMIKDLPQLPKDAGVPVDLIRSANGIHMVGHIFCYNDWEIISVLREDTIILISTVKRRLIVIGRPKQRNGAGYLVEEAVRTLWRGWMEGKGWTLLHAASVVHHDTSWVIIGEKGAGKTTLQCALLEKGYKLVSTDRTFICFGEGKGVINGWPGGMKVEPHTLTLVPNFRERVANSLDYKTLGNSKLRIPLRALSRILGRIQMGPYPLGGYIFLRRNTEESSFSYRSIEKSEMMERLHSNILNNQSDLRKNWLRTERWWKHKPIHFQTAPSLELSGNGHPDEMIQAIEDFFLKQTPVDRM